MSSSKSPKALLHFEDFCKPKYSYNQYSPFLFIQAGNRGKASYAHVFCTATRHDTIGSCSFSIRNSKVGPYILGQLKVIRIRE
jgi:hypothetical protein